MWSVERDNAGRPVRMRYMGRDRKREDPNITPPVPGCPGCGMHFGWHKKGCESRKFNPTGDQPNDR